MEKGKKKKAKKNRPLSGARDICLLPGRSAFSHGIVCLADMRQGHFEKHVRRHTMDERTRQSRSRAFAGLFTSRPSTSCLLPPLAIRQVNSRTRDTHDRSYSTRFSRPRWEKTFHVQGLHASETQWRISKPRALVLKFLFGLSRLNFTQIDFLFEIKHRKSTFYLFIWYIETSTSRLSNFLVTGKSRKKIINETNVYVLKTLFSTRKLNKISKNLDTQIKRNLYSH